MTAGCLGQSWRARVQAADLNGLVRGEPRQPAVVRPLFGRDHPNRLRLRATVGKLGEGQTVDPSQRIMTARIVRVPLDIALEVADQTIHWNRFGQVNSCSKCLVGDEQQRREGKYAANGESAFHESREHRDLLQIAAAATVIWKPQLLGGKRGQ